MDNGVSGPLGVTVLRCAVLALGYDSAPLCGNRICVEHLQAALHKRLRSALAKAKLGVMSMTVSSQRGTIGLLVVPLAWASVSALG